LTGQTEDSEEKYGSHLPLARQARLYLREGLVVDLLHSQGQRVRRSHHALGDVPAEG
jgi:transposase